MTLNDLAREIHKNACDHGWWGDLSDYRQPFGDLVATPEDTEAVSPIRRNFGEVLALIHSEVSEALEEYRDGRAPTETHYKWELPADFPYEVSARATGWYVRSDHPGSNAKLLNREQFLNLLRIHKVPLKPEGVPSEFADIIIRVLDACAAYGIDIDAAIAEKMAYNATRPYKHGGRVI